MEPMKSLQKIAFTYFGLLMLAGGCCWPAKTPTPPLGTQSDAIWRRQEAGASASDFVIYEHEFVVDPEGQGKIRLNTAGEDHLKSIAARLNCGAPLPVVVERSMISEHPDSKYHYPVNPNPELDMKRREVVVKALVGLGIANADQCVVVAPAIAEGLTATEASRAYHHSLTNSGRGNGYGGSSAGGLGGIGVGGTIR
jgi:hypothetical protein